MLIYLSLDILYDLIISEVRIPEGEGEETVDPHDQEQDQVREVDGCRRI